MTGAEALLRALESAGIRACFVNPGTTELPILSALDAVPGIRPVLCLAEGVAAGAADGYARMSRHPAGIVLHLGPGLANGISNLHNARRAGSPVVVIVGDHPRWHLRQDPPLAMDIELLARSVSARVSRAESADAIANEVDAAISSALAPPGSISTLIVPSDAQRALCAGSAARGARPFEPSPAEPSPVPERRIADSLRRLAGGSAALLLGNAGLRPDALHAAAALSQATGCRLLSVPFPARLELGRGYPKLERVPYLRSFAASFFDGLTQLVLAGATEPRDYFAGDSREPFVPPQIETSVLASDREDVVGALKQLAALQSARTAGRAPAAAHAPAAKAARLSARMVVDMLAEQQIEGAIVIDEGISIGGAYPGTAAVASAAPHTYLSLTGGATGFGLSCAIGAAIAAPDRKVVVISGDGSALYHFQALWTQARERLNILNLILANDAYRILKFELETAGGQTAVAARRLTELSPPTIDWVRLSESFGVPASRATDPASFREMLRHGLTEPGPRLIEARVWV